MKTGIKLPFKGISENLAFQSQEEITSRDLENMRAQDPPTGRVRLSQRSGVRKYNTNVINGASVKVSELNTVAFDSRNTTYSAVPSQGADIVWEQATTTASDTRAIAVDRQGNIFVLDGNSSVTKYSADGNKLFTIAVPVKDDGDQLGSIFVDSVDDIYVASTSGVRQDLTRIWKYTQLPSNEYELEWELETNAYVPKMKVVVDKLYTIQNEPDTKSSWVRVYEALEADQPILERQFLIPYPCNGFDVKSDGSIVICCPFDGDNGTSTTIALPYQRGPNPKFPNNTPTLVDWTPFDLTDFERRIWAWFRAEDINEFDVFGDFIDGAPIRVWRDVSKFGRHLFAAVGTSVSVDAVTTPCQPPTLTRRGLGIWPSVKFNGVDQAFITLRNGTTALEFADQQKTLLPAYTNNMYCVFVVFRAAKEAQKRWLIGHGQGPGAGEAFNHMFFVNRQSGSSLPGTTNSGKVCVYAASAAAPGDAAGNNDHPLEGSFDNNLQLGLITFLWDGGVNGGGGKQGTGFTRSIWRINGFPIDRFEGNQDITTLLASMVGAYTVSSSGHKPLAGDILEILVLDRQNRSDVTFSDPTNLVLTHNRMGDEPGGEDEAAGAQDGTFEMNRIEGYLAHKYGFAHLLPKSSDTYPHPYGRAALVTGSMAAGPPTGGSTGHYAKLGSSSPLVAKFSARGELIWAINGVTTADQNNDATAGRVGGLGYDVAVNSEGDIYSIGPKSALGGTVEDVQLCKLKDQGTTVSAAFADGAWGVTVGADLGASSFVYPRLAVDKFDNVFAPVNTGANTKSLLVYTKTGTKLVDFSFTGTLEGTAVAIDPDVPDYLSQLTNNIAEHCYISTENGGTSTNPTIHKLRFVRTAVAGGSVRTFANVAVAGSAIKVFTEGAGAPTTPTGGSSAISSSAIYVHSVTHFGKVYFTDGTGAIKVFDPRMNTVTDLEATNGGRAPFMVKIIESWRGRLVACRGVGLIDEAFNWKMSAINDPLNWDLFPPVRNSAQAVAGVNAIGPGKVSDIVNGFIPYSDDIAFFLCDHSIWQLTGDPMDGGQLDLISDITGGAFGRAWCKDPEGNVFFFGSRGGIYVLRPGSIPERISLNNIERRLQNINLTTHYPRLAWNYQDEGVNIFLMPYGSATQAEHYFWDAKTGSMWVDKFGLPTLTGIQPTSTLVIDGDEVDDRVLLIGCADGFVRRWDKSQRDDDGNAINAQVLIGPLAGPDPMMETRFVGPQVILADDRNGARYELFATNEPDRLGDIVHSGDLHPGINPMIRNRVRALYTYLRLRNSSLNQSFAVESVAMEAYAAGRKRVREQV